VNYFSAPGVILMIFGGDVESFGVWKTSLRNAEPKREWFFQKHLLILERAPTTQGWH
jgi:hypothetical protein